MRTRSVLAVILSCSLLFILASCSTSSYASASSSGSSEQDKPVEPTVVTSENITDVNVGDWITITAEAQNITETLNGAKGHADAILTIEKPGGLHYYIYANDMSYSSDEIREMFPDINVGTMYNSGRTKYRITLQGQVDSTYVADYGLNSITLENVTILGGEPF